MIVLITCSVCFYFNINIAKYAMYIKKYIIPFALLILSFGGINGNNANITVATINMLISKLYVTLYVIGFIIDATPRINNILNIFDPIIFPIAMSLFPFIAAVTLVTNSGRLVPTARIVKLIIFSLMLK